MIYLSRPYPFRFFKDCLPQTLLGPLLNTLSQMKQILKQQLLTVKPWNKNEIKPMQASIKPLNFFQNISIFHIFVTASLTINKFLKTH